MREIILNGSYDQLPNRLSYAGISSSARCGISVFLTIKVSVGTLRHE